MYCYVLNESILDSDPFIEDVKKIKEDYDDFNRKYNEYSSVKHDRSKLPQNMLSTIEHMSERIKQSYTYLKNLNNDIKKYNFTSVEQLKSKIEKSELSKYILYDDSKFKIELRQKLDETIGFFSEEQILHSINDLRITMSDSKQVYSDIVRKGYELRKNDGSKYVEVSKSLLVCLKHLIRKILILFKELTKNF